MQSRVSVFAVLSILGIALGACDGGTPVGSDSPEAAAALRGSGEPSLNAGPSPSLPPLSGPIPAAPEYAAAALGKKLVEVAPKPSESCAGHLDVVAGRYAGDPGAVSVKGWAWNSGAKSPFTQIYAIDSFGTILAGAVVGEARPDVPAALPETVLTDKVGWTIAVPVSSGNLTVVGFDPAAGSSCLVGTAAIPAP